MNKCELCGCLGGYHMTTCDLYNAEWDGYPRKSCGFDKGDDLIEYLTDRVH